ncbi:putative uncharacterized protein [Waddlia chondrophila 2032/99]|nr:putative uncharacterized protein [Waddlia chondrophila 2032/99]
MLGVLMNTPIPPVGGPAGQSPIDPKIGSTRRTEIEPGLEILPDKPGNPVSSNEVKANCDWLEKSSLPDILGKVVSAAQDAEGRIPIGPLVSSARNPEVLAAMFATLSNRE